MAAEDGKQVTDIAEPSITANQVQVKSWRPMFHYHVMKARFRVTIKNAAKYNKEVILFSLMKCLVPQDCFLLEYCVEGDDACVTVKTEVENVFGVPPTLTISSGVEFTLSAVSETRPDTVNIKQLLTEALIPRYNIENKTLDLSNFHMDPVFGDKIFCSLGSIRIINMVGFACQPCYSLVTCINLSSNKLESLENPSFFFKGAHQLKSLNLGNNLIEDVDQVRHLARWRIEDLNLDGNPLCGKYENELSYIMAVKKYIPRLKVLDGVPLPDPIMPLPKCYFLCSENGRKVVEQFVIHYYSLYDGDKREELLDTYHKEALFSLSTSSLKKQDNSPHGRLHRYLMESRNLLKIMNLSKVHLLLHHGKEKIVTFLSKLPQTEHDPCSFSVDLVHFTAKMMVISVCGMFRETGVTNKPMRSFQRTFAIVPLQKKFCIVNDELFVTNVTEDQLKAAFTVVPDVEDGNAVLVSSSLSKAEEELRKEMVETLAYITKMKLEWSKKCLNETAWDLKEALIVFTELFKQNKIPPAAFAN